MYFKCKKQTAKKENVRSIHVCVLGPHVHDSIYLGVPPCVCVCVCVCVYKGNKYLLVYAREKFRKCTRMFTVGSFFCGVETEG